MHNVIHHGSVLQAYATQLLFERLGYDTVIIDYKYPNRWQEEHGIHIYRSSLKTRIAQCLGLKAKYRRRKKILRFMKKYYQLTCKYSDINELKANPPSFDIYVTGSDQVWNPRFTCADPAYFFTFEPEDSNIMSFSSSFACSSLNDDVAKFYKDYLSRYKFISVRENQGAKIVQKLLGKTPSVTLDPTLMIDASQWNKFVKPSRQNREYIFMYMLDYAFDPKPYIFELAKYFSEKYDKPIISISEIPTKYKIKYSVRQNVGIEDFLSLISNSFMVITSSFHGAAFSVNFGIPIISVVKNDANDDRLSTLLQNLELEKCIARIGTPATDLSPFYDVKQEQKLLNELRQVSKNYLETALTYFKNENYDKGFHFSSNI